MNYKKGTDVLPARLLKEIQEYVDGGLIYIPKRGIKASWGQLSGARQSIDKRNNKIIWLFEQGETIQNLSDKFHLGEDSIKKIIYGKKQI